MPPKAAPHTIDEICERSINTIVTARDLRAMFKDDGFIKCSSRNDQLIFARSFLKEVCYISANNKLLAILFNISDGNVRKILCKARKKQNQNGRPFILTDDQENLVVAELQSKRTTMDFMTIPQMIRYVEETFQKCITRGWVYRFLYRHRDALIKTEISPQEELRLKVPRTYLIEFMNLVEKIITIVPADLVYNIDETGLSDWENRKPKTVIIPKDLENEDLHYPVNRGIRHITLVVTISGGGDAYFPLIVTSDSSLEHIFDHGVRRDVDLSIHVGDSSYITKDVFKDHIINKFIPQVENDRISCGSESLLAVLFFDNCSSHLDDELLRILAANNIIVITYPPHCSHIFQVLDLLLFGVLKIHKKHIPKDETISPKIDHLLRIFKAYEMSTCSCTVRSSFEKAGFKYFQKNGKNFMKFDRSKIENSSGFKEIWNIDYPEAKVSTRRRNQKRGWVNKEYFSFEIQRKILNS